MAKKAPRRFACSAKIELHDLHLEKENVSVYRKVNVTVYRKGSCSAYRKENVRESSIYIMRKTS